MSQSTLLCPERLLCQWPIQYVRIFSLVTSLAPWFEVIHEIARKSQITTEYRRLNDICAVMLRQGHIPNTASLHYFSEFSTQSGSYKNNTLADYVDQINALTRQRFLPVIHYFLSSWSIPNFLRTTSKKPYKYCLLVTSLM